MINSIHGIISKATPVVITPPEGLVILTDWVLLRMAIQNENDFRPTAADARAYSPSFIPVGGIGEVRGRSFITIFGLDREVTADPYSSLDYAVWRSQSGRVGTFNNNAGTELVAVPVGTYERVRCDGSMVHFEYSLDNGVNWIAIQSPVPQLQEKLYPKISTDPGETLDSVWVAGLLKD